VIEEHEGLTVESGEERLRSAIMAGLPGMGMYPGPGMGPMPGSATLSGANKFNFKMEETNALVADAYQRSAMIGATLGQGLMNIEQLGAAAQGGRQQVLQATIQRIGQH
jgi:hypothetical protein